MTYQDDLHSAETPHEQPTMELLEGAEAPVPAKPSFAARLARGSLYGVLLLSATALLAISAVPELATYLPESRSKSSCYLSSGSCTTLDVASLKNVSGSPCCPLAAAALESDSGGCSKSCARSEALASVSAEIPGCCQKSSSCREEDGACPLTLAKSSDDQSNTEDVLAKLPAADELTTVLEASEPPAPPVAE